ncbi:MAG TPA: membrane protein insertase YidC [Chitinophagaceae bacterium]|nr:membrane protein insertase YidC [Chitinophagaceae bacterium]
MNMDKNTVIGFILIAALLIGFMWYNTPSKEQLAQEQHIADSTAQAQAQAAKAKAANIQAKAVDTVKLADSTLKNTLAAATIGNEELTVVENNVLKAVFTNEGGRLQSVELKNYKSSYNGKNIVLAGGEDDNLAYSVNTSDKTTDLTSKLFFQHVKVDSAADGTKTVTYTLASAEGQSITHQYVIHPGSYMIDWNIIIGDADKVLPHDEVDMQWQSHPVQHEKSASYERIQTNVCFYENNSFDYISSKNDHKFEAPVQWVGIVQQFFNTTLISKSNFNSGDIHWVRRTDTTNILGDVTVNLQQKVPAGHQANVALQLYYGPNDYHILGAQTPPDMDKMVNLGRDLYSFVRPINKYIIMPVFGFFSSFVGNLGWAILLLTLFIRLVTSPLTYTSYLSGAKMKVLRPELDAIKKKTGSDQQAFAMEQMKLFREAGVNPLGGCIPALLQIPIFFALYSFFNSSIALRGVHFLWSNDLSSYDTLFHFKSDVWLIGDHISLFCLTAIITSFLISIYNLNSTPTQGNPAMKYMPYIFPFILFFVFNRLPSALTWYYTVSNLITLGIQFVIQTYIIDHDKILRQLDEKRKAPKPKSKFQERYSQMMEAQKKVQDLKNKQQGKK